MRRSFLALWAPVFAYMLFLMAAQLWPSPPPPPVGLTDKHEHFFFYGILAIILLRALVKGRWHRISVGAALGAIVYSSLYGVFAEFCQRLVPSRSYEVVDMVADSIGAALAVGLVFSWSIITRRPERHDVL